MHGFLPREPGASAEVMARLLYNKREAIVGSFIIIEFNEDFTILFGPIIRIGVIIFRSG